MKVYTSSELHVMKTLIDEYIERNKYVTTLDAIRLSLDFDAIISLYSQIHLRNLKVELKKINEHTTRNILKRVHDGESMLTISNEFKLGNFKFAKVVIEALLEKKLSINDFLLNPNMIENEKIREELISMLSTDQLSSHEMDLKKECLGKEYEILLINLLNERHMCYETEDELRNRGKPRTPDILFLIPMATSKWNLDFQSKSHIYPPENSDLIVINWIDSKAMFADMITFQEHLEQFRAYHNRYGRGMVIYWHGFEEGILTIVEEDMIVVKHSFPDYWIFPSGDVADGISNKDMKKLNEAEDSTTADYTIISVTPILITNDQIVTVQFSSLSPSSNDWIGAYSPPNVSVLTTSPVKYGMCNAASNSQYVSTGYGELLFNMTNLRAGIKFYYFTNGLSKPILIANSSEIVNFQNVNQPLKNRIVASGDPNIFKLLWSSASSKQPLLKWGTVSNVYNQIAYAETTQITRSSLCGAPANETGWFDLGLIHTANITGIIDKQLNSKIIYYIFGDAATNDFSNQKTFYVPPKAGTQPPTRATQVVLMADLGVGSTDSSYDTNIWDEPLPPAINTTMSIGNLILQGEVDAVYHSGDISYANGFLAGWDFFMDMITPLAGSVVYLTTVGNHESDWPNTASLPYGSASGGECGVVDLRMLPMPAPATVNQPWWSYDIGIIHFVGMSTEHNFTIGSPQYQWLQKDLSSVNRTITPWIVFSGHRSMYVDSNQCCPNSDPTCTVCSEGSDVGVMLQLRANVEPLLYKYKVNLAFAGHFHDAERQSAVYQNKVVQKAEIITTSEGYNVAFHNQPNATVWMLIGSAGNGPSIASINYSWSEKYWDNMFGYAIITAVNATVLNWQLIESSTNQVIDRMMITQADSTQTVTSGSSPDDNNIGVIVATYVIISIAGLMVLILTVKLIIIPKYSTLFSHQFVPSTEPNLESHLLDDPNLITSSNSKAIEP